MDLQATNETKETNVKPTVRTKLAALGQAPVRPDVYTLDERDTAIMEYFIAHPRERVGIAELETTFAPLAAKDIRMAIVRLQATTSNLATILRGNLWRYTPPGPDGAVKAHRVEYDEPHRLPRRNEPLPTVRPTLDETREAPRFNAKDVAHFTDQHFAVESVRDVTKTRPELAWVIHVTLDDGTAYYVTVEKDLNT
jgi:hypothetical protein